MAVTWDDGRQLGHQDEGLLCTIWLDTDLFQTGGITHAFMVLKA